MFTAAFWKASAERAIKTFAQVLAAVLVVGLGIEDVDWQRTLSTALLATLASFLTSIVSSQVGGPGPSLGTEKLPAALAAPRHAGPNGDLA